MSIVKVSLGEKNGMWFIGEPRQIKLVLSAEQPGPVEVETLSLNQSEHLHLVLSVGSKTVITDSTYEILAGEYNSRFFPAEPAAQPVPPRKRGKPKGTKVNGHEMVVARCRKLLKSGVRAVKSAMISSENIKMLQILRDLEMKGQHRVSLLDFLNERIKVYENSLAAKLAKDTSPPSTIDTFFPRDTLLKVEDSDFEEVTISEKVVGKVQDSAE